MKTYVIYFSPTGGTKMVANYITKELGADDIDVTVRCLDMSIEKDDLVFFCVPVYAGRVPIPVYERMAHIKGNDTPAVIIACYGNRAVDDTLIEMSELIKRKGFRTVGGGEVITPHAFNPEVGKFRPDEDDRALISDFLKKLKAKPELTEVQMPGDPKYGDKKRTKLPIYPIPAKECIGCGICFNNCPMKAISDVRMKVKAKSCISCMRCIDMCSTSSRHLDPVTNFIIESLVAPMGIVRKTPKFYL